MSVARSVGTHGGDHLVQPAGVGGVPGLAAALELREGDRPAIASRRRGLAVDPEELGDAAEPARGPRAASPPAPRSPRSRRGRRSPPGCRRSPRRCSRCRSWRWRRRRRGCRGRRSPTRAGWWRGSRPRSPFCGARGSAGRRRRRGRGGRPRARSWSATGRRASAGHGLGVRRGGHPVLEHLDDGTESRLAHEAPSRGTGSVALGPEDDSAAGRCHGRKTAEKVRRLRRRLRVRSGRRTCRRRDPPRAGSGRSR